MTTSGRIAVVLATALGVLCAPSAAFAADWHVSKAGDDMNSCSSPAPTDACLTIQHVAGAVANDGDTVHIGPGIYAEAVSAAGKQLTFLGAGQGTPDSFNSSTDTLIRPTSNDVALRMMSGGTVRSLRVEGGSSPPAVDNAPGMLLSAVGAGGPIPYSVSDVVATGGMKGGLSVDGIVVNDGGTGRFVRTSIADTAARYLGAAGINVFGANVSAAITRTTLIPLATQKQVALLLAGGASATMAESTVSDNFPTTGISVSDPGSSLGLVRSTVRVQGLPLLVANAAAGTTQAIALDSELADINPVGTFPEAVLLRNTAVAAGAHITFAARGSTLVSRGAPPANQTLGGLLLAGPGVPGSTVDATLQNSVVRAERTDGDPAHFDVGAANQASATLDHSSYTDVLTQAGGAVTPPGTAGGVTGNPGFAAAASGDFSLSAGSPLVDRGDPAVAGPNELDLAGAPRSVDGDGDCVAAPDIGAFERPDVHASCGSGGGGGGGSSGAGGGGGSAATPTTGGPLADLVPASVSGFGLERKRFAVARGPTAVSAASRRRQAPRGSAFKYAISEPATAQIAIDRASAGLRSGRRCAKPSRALRRRHARRCTRYTRAGTLVRAAAQGANRHPFTGRIGRRALKAARYRATITTTDIAGNVSTASTASFRIVRR